MGVFLKGRGVLLGLLLLLLAGACSGLIHKLEVSEDPRDFFQIEDFGFVAGGSWTLAVSDFSVYARPEYKVGFVMINATSESGIEQDIEDILESDKCLLDTSLQQNPDRVMDLSDPTSWESTTTTHIVGPKEKGLYSLLFVRCKPTHVTVSFNLKASFQNPGPNYLSAGETELPAVYYVAFAAFLAAGVGWMVLMKKGSAHIHQIHHTMSVLLLFKTLSMLFEGIRYHFLKVSGAAEVWSVVYYSFAFLKAIMLFVVILLIGTGWSLVKPYLNDREKRIILAVLILQVVDNIAVVIIDETAPGSMKWVMWQSVLHMLDIVCCFAILFPIVWSIRHLRQAAQADGKSAHTLRKLDMFRQFYVLVFSYIYFTRIIVFLLGVTLPFELQWIGNLAAEAGTLVFYMATGWKFRPEDQNPYLLVDRSQDQDDVPERDDEGDFELSATGPRGAV